MASHKDSNQSFCELESRTFFNYNKQQQQQQQTDMEVEIAAQCNWMYNGYEPCMSFNNKSAFSLQMKYHLRKRHRRQFLKTRCYRIHSNFTRNITSTRPQQLRYCYGLNNGFKTVIDQYPILHFSTFFSNRWKVQTCSICQATSYPLKLPTTLQTCLTKFTQTCQEVFT